MTINDAITKLRVMLNSSEEVVQVVETKMAEATLVDSTVVYTEGELIVGAVLYVSVAEGEAPFAPEGIHETTEGLLITVGMNGVIEAIEEVATEETPEAAAPEAAPAATEELLSAIVDIVAPYQEQIKTLKNEMSLLTERFNAIAEMPAAAPVKRNFGAEATAVKELENARVARLASIRNNKNKNK